MFQAARFLIPKIQESKSRAKQGFKIQDSRWLTNIGNRKWIIETRQS